MGKDKEHKKAAGNTSSETKTKALVILPNNNTVVADTETDTGESLQERFTKQLCSYHIGLDGVMESDKPFRYLMTKGGVMKVMKNKVGLFVTKTDNVIGLPEVNEGLLLSVPKIPYHMFDTAIDFFKEVMKTKNDAEAMVQFYYDEENKEYIIYCPEQEVTGGGISFKRNQEYDEKYILVMDIHSHNTMSAFFSNIDDADEKETRLFGVVGRLDRSSYEYKFRINIGGTFRAVDIWDIFERPFEKREFPKEWLDRCKRVSSTSKGGVVIYSSGKKVQGTHGKKSPGANDSNTKTSIYSDDWYDSYYGLYGYGGYGYGTRKYDKIETDEDVKKYQTATQTASKTEVDGEDFFADIYYLTTEQRIQLAKDLLEASLIEVAQAIKELNVYDELTDIIIKNHFEDTTGEDIDV